MGKMSALPSSSITGVILAGGRGSRMGGEDKGLVLYQGKPLYQHVLARLSPQVHSICINANRNLPLYQQSGLKVVQDTLPGFPGPLAGMLAALQFIDSEWAVFTPCDTPGLPANLVFRLWQEKRSSPVVWARTADRDHPALALVHISVAKALASFLDRGERQVMLFFKQAGGHAVLFDDAPTAFANINRPEDLLT